jgi:tight adherence protein B
VNRRGWRPYAATVLASMVLGLVALPVLAQSGPQVQLRDARLDPDGQTRLVVSVDGLPDAQLDASAFQVFEDGQDVGDLQVDAVVDRETGEAAVAAVLLLDVSGSMAGEPLEQIRAAAAESTRTLVALDIPVGLVEFATRSSVLSEPSLDEQALLRSLEQLEAGGWTALHDAVIDSVALLEDTAGSRSIIVFADGQDNRSEATIDEAVEAATQAAIPISVVVLETDRLDLSALEPLAARTGGRLVSVTDVEDLRAAFAAVTQDIANQYVIRYHSEILEPSELPITVLVETAGGDTRVDSLAINAREAGQIAPPTPQPSILGGPRWGFLATTTGLVLGISAAFLAALALLWAVIVSTQRTAGSRTLERGLRTVGRRETGEQVELPTSRLTERAIDLVGRVPKPRGFDQRLQIQLDRAAWPVRTNEFLVLCVGSAVLGGILLGGMTRSLVIALLAGGLAGAVPVLVMRIRIDRRRRAFMDQLPATLQLLAGSLRAGYGLLQAIDTVVKEADDPTSPEFARVLTEARLGMPLEEALEGMAQRLDSDDFHWVVLAIGIQREVGGNLAELLTTVAATMRGRATLRRQIKVLSAEGRISAWVIGVMPFVVAVALQVVNPGYLNELFQQTVGLVLLVVGAVLIAIGAFWLKQIVNIEV